MANKLNIPECRFVNPNETITLTVRNYDLIITPDDLFRDSEKTYKETGIKPSELLQQRNELLNALKMALMLLPRGMIYNDCKEVLTSMQQ